MSPGGLGAWPWLSLCWVVVCVAAILGIDSPVEEPKASAPAPARIEAAGYWRSHSYLSAP